MECFLALATIVAFAQTSLTLAQGVSEVLNDNRNVEVQMQHAEERKKQRSGNKDLLTASLPKEVQDQIQISLRSLSAATTSISPQLQPCSIKGRLRWITYGKKASDRASTRQLESEVSVILVLCVRIFEFISSTNPSPINIQTRQQVLETAFSRENMQSISNIEQTLVKIQAEQQRTADHSRNWMARMDALEKRVGHQVLSQTGQQRTGHRHKAKISLKRSRHILLSWVLRSITWDHGRYDNAYFSITVAVLQMTAILYFDYNSRFWFPWPQISIRHRKVIPEDSSVISACLEGDLPRLEKLLDDGEAGPNDAAPDNSTLLRYAIESGSQAVVRRLLERGADPNLTFREKDHAPLNSAFYYGRADIAQLLIDHDANVDYVNGRAWTSVFYLWGPGPSRPRYEQLVPLLQICDDAGFTSWDLQDSDGWALIHQVAAFGTGQDIQYLTNIFNLDVQAVTPWHWRPLHIAARWGNLSTFDVLIVLDPMACNFAFFPDREGWTLLHHAAWGGEEAIIVQLLQAGADEKKLTVPTCIGVPEALQGKPLHPRDIARARGNLEIFETAVATVDQERRSRF